jgi:hypothetical protein
LAIAARAKPHALIFARRANAQAAAIDASTEFGFSENGLTAPPHCGVLVLFRPTRAALRDRHERWVRDAVDAKVLSTNSTQADEEVVWSWRPDAGAKFCG